MEALTKEKLDHYFLLTTEALLKAREAPENLDIHDGTRTDFLDMIERYLKDALYFAEQGREMDSFAALNYAHGWLDAGARIGLWDVGDSRLFTVDDHKAVDPESKRLEPENDPHLSSSDKKETEDI